MRLLSLDLELNKNPVRIIQVGLAVGDTDTGEILETAGYFVKIPGPLDPYITTLTGITEADLATGGSILDAYKGMCALAEKYECYCNPLQWGGGDIDALGNEVYESVLDFDCYYKWPFGRRHIDAKTVFQTYMLANGLKMQAGLAKALTRLGMQFKGRKHNAVDDATNTFRIYHELLKRLKD